MTDRYHDQDNEMVQDFDEVVELGKEMEQISLRNEEDRDNDWSEEDEQQNS
ncbi:SAS053 family DNA gyrase inhibitor [Macrococcus lamae]|uniref:SAS053 family DNA gyrase inhibitor n=1 Tax=Macrococcus lamae TaxID=198484 RepID=UPI00140A66AB|nr:SAS053 family protein [Macrococcus lamae]